MGLSRNFLCIANRVFTFAPYPGAPPTPSVVGVQSFIVFLRLALIS
jgi:hypothetical protein